MDGNEKVGLLREGRVLKPALGRASNALAE